MILVDALRPKSFTRSILSFTRVGTWVIDNPKVTLEVTIAALTEYTTKWRSVAIGKGENVNNAGSRVRGVVAAVESIVSYGVDSLA